MCLLAKIACNCVTVVSLLFCNVFSTTCCTSGEKPGGEPCFRAIVLFGLKSLKIFGTFYLDICIHFVKPSFYSVVQSNQ